MLTKIVNGVQVALTQTEIDEFEQNEQKHINYIESLEYLQEKARESRKNIYPTIQDQLDMLYHDKMNNTTTWFDAISQVKIEIPIPQIVESKVEKE